MARDLKYSDALKNAQLDAITALVGSAAKLALYNGTKPTAPSVAVTSQLKLAEFTCPSTFAPAASVGILTANTITSTTGLAAAASGTNATWFRLSKSDNTAVIDGTIGVASGVLFTGSISNNTLNVTVVASGTFLEGMLIEGSGVPSGTVITEFGTGSGNTGTYHLNTESIVGSSALTASSAYDMTMSNVNIAAGQTLNAGTVTIINGT